MAASSTPRTLKRWRPGDVLGQVGSSPRVVVVAASNSGKTVLTRAILGPLMVKHPEDGGYDGVWVLSRSDATLENWEDLVPLPEDPKAPLPLVNIKRHTVFLQALVNVLGRADMRTVDILDQDGRPTGRTRPRRSLVVLDDILEQGKTRYDVALSGLFTEGRHIGVTTVLITQSLSEISTTIRKNASTVLIGRLTSGTELEGVAKQYLGYCLPADPKRWPRPEGMTKATHKLLTKASKKHAYLVELVRRTTENYGFVVVDFDRPSTDWDKCVRVYRVTRRPKAPARSPGNPR